MSVTYSTAAINARLQGVADTIDTGATNGTLKLRAGATTLSTISLARPCGSVNGGILTFVGMLSDGNAANTGNADNAIITDGNGATVVSGLTVGIPVSGSDVILSNGLNSTLIISGQTVILLSAQITGS